jgi:apolipoprotein N-acyltransferase
MQKSYTYYAHNTHLDRFYYYSKLILSPIAGALAVLSFAPFHIWPLAIISVAMICFCFLTSTRAIAFLQGWLYGLGYFGLGASWVFISIHRFGGANWALSAALTLLLVMFMSLFYGAAGYVLRRWLHRNFAIDCLCGFPAIWMCAEWLRGHILTGFPWLVLGYSQTQGPLASFAPIIGVYGISMLISFTAGCLALLMFRVPQERYLWGIGSVAVIWLLAIPLDLIDWTQADAPPMQVSIVQGNIPQKDKWNSDLAPQITQRYIDLTQSLWQSKLILWPEAAITTTPQEMQPLLEPEHDKAIQHNSAILLGAPIYNPENDRYYNGAIMMSAAGGTYLKRHLVPFGEFFPLKSMFSWVYKQLSIPQSDLSPGPDQQPLMSAGGNAIAPYICYEIAFPSEVASHLHHGQIIAVMTDDSWFGDSLAARQHLEMAQMRARENGRFLIFASNTGPSAIINAQGIIIAKSTKDKALTLTAEVEPMSKTTPYTLLTDHLTGLMITLLLFVAFLYPRPMSNIHKYQRVEFTIKPERHLAQCRRLIKKIKRILRIH